MTKSFILKVPYSRETMHDVCEILYEHFNECEVLIRRGGGMLEIEVPNKTPLSDALKRYETARTS